MKSQFVKFKSKLKRWADFSLDSTGNSSTIDVGNPGDGWPDGSLLHFPKFLEGMGQWCCKKTSVEVYYFVVLLHFHSEICLLPQGGLPLL